MMRDAMAIYKPNKASRSWYVRFYDRTHQRRKVRAFPSKRDSEIMERHIHDLQHYQAHGGETPARIIAWMQNSLDAKQMADLVTCGVVDAAMLLVGLPLTDHLEAWRQAIVDRRATAKHADLSKRRASVVLDHSHAYILTDIDPGAIQATIGEWSRADKLSEYELHHRLRAIKSFTRWCVQTRRLHRDPLAGMKVPTVRKQKSPRRALTVAEQTKLLATVQASHVVRMGLDGPTRALLYRVALETGLRINEIRSLRACDLDLRNGCLRLAPEHDKSRRGANLELRPALLAMLTEHVANLMPDAAMFRIYDIQHAAARLRADLKEAGILPTVGGRKVDFHALRHTFGSTLAAAGVAPKTLMDLMRHSDINLTMKYYTHSFAGDHQRALSNLPDFQTEGDQRKGAI